MRKFVVTVNGEQYEVVVEDTSEGIQVAAPAAVTPKPAPAAAAAPTPAAKPAPKPAPTPVSYTHLDVYKRQPKHKIQ